METSLSAQSADDRNEGHGISQEPPGGPVLPLHFTRSPISAFVDFDIVGHPYIDSIELQELATGHHAALVHHRGVVDVYVDPGAGLDEQWFHRDPAFINLQRRAFHLTPIETERWEFNNGAVDLWARFALFDHTPVEVVVRQTRSNDHWITQFIPTPPVRDLQMLRFLHVRGFGLLRAGSGTTAVINIGTNSFRPANSKIPIGGRRRYSVRFAESAQMFGLNRPGDFPIDKTYGTPGRPGHPSDGLSWNLGTIHQDESGGFHATISFDSNMNGRTLHNVTKAKMRWSEADSGQHVAFDQVEQNWLPPFSTPELRAIALVRRWRRRRLSISWTGMIKQATNDSMVIGSQWSTNRG